MSNGKRQWINPALWRVTGGFIDHGSPTAECELCGKADLRYQYEISDGKGEMWVGSDCILRFEVPVFKDGQRLDEAGARRRLGEIRDDARRTACLDALRKVAKAEQNAILLSALAFYDRNGTLTPRLANVVLWRLRTHGIEHSPALFKIRLTHESDREAMKQMPPFQIANIWPALSSSQRQLVRRLGVQSPPAVG